VIASPSRVLPAWFWLVGPAVVTLLLAANTTTANFPVIVPLAVQLAAVGIVVGVLWHRRRGLVPWFEIGVVYATIVAFYGTYPLIKFLVVGEAYRDFVLDGRWSALDPTTAEVAYAGWIYTLHLIAFAATYLIVRGRLPVVMRQLRGPSTPAFIAVVVLYVVIQGFWFFLGLFYDTSAGSYAETYLVSQRLPLVLAQLLNHLSGAKYPLSLIVLVGLFDRYPASRRVIIAWIVLIGALTLIRFGSRTEFALLLMAAGMTYHTVVRPISPQMIAAGVAAGLLAFLVYGVVRGVSPGAALSLNPFIYATEFDILFGNVIHLARVAAESSTQVPTALYFIDLAALIPQQLAPFQKVEAAAWYASTFYPEYWARGGGFAFGTMAEAVLTGGLVSAAARGALLGFLFAKLHRFYVRRADRYWVFVFYLWVTTLSYLAFRGTTLVLLVLFVFRFLPVMIAVKLIGGGLERTVRQTRLWWASGTA
jgi:hypothetical protein